MNQIKNNNLIYGITDKPKYLKEYLYYGAQQCLSIFTATVLISTICGTDVAAGLVGAGVATLIFLLLTGFKCPMFFSNSGSTCSGVILALSLCGNYTGALIGGLSITIMNIIAALLIKSFGSEWIDRLLPKIVSGTIVLIIGLNLSFFSPTYALVNGEYNLIGVLVAFATMFATAAFMYYGKGRISTLPFLCGIGVGYGISIIITMLGIADLVDFNAFSNMSLFILPDFAWRHIDLSSIDGSAIWTIILAYCAVNLANLGEHISDVMACSTITHEDIPKTVGLHRTMFADGIADLVGCIFSGQPTTTYSESLSTIVVSKVASTRVIAVAALMTSALGFFGPLNALIISMPGCIFSGVSLVAYGSIAYSGLKVLQEVDLSKPRNLLIFACMGSVGISGIKFTIGGFTLETIALSMIIGILLNLLLKED